MFDNPEINTCVFVHPARAWRGSGEHPFLLDNVFDIMCCLDYLAERPETDMSRVGITGVCMCVLVHACVREGVHVHACICLCRLCMCERACT